MNTPPNTAAASETPESPETTSKEKIFIVVKATVLYLVLLYGIRAHMKESGLKSKVLALFLYYVLVVTSILVYELVGAYIPLLFYTRMLSMIGSLWQFNLLIKPVLAHSKYPNCLQAAVRGMLAPLLVILMMGGLP